MRILITLLLLGIFSILTAQPTVIKGEVRHLTPEEIIMDSANRHCIETNNYTAKQRLQNYPFNRAKQVQLLSFDMPANVIMGGEVPVKKGILNQERVKETITLSASQIDSLTHILYNISYQGPFFTILEGLCYSPRNAILFNNSKGKTFAFIEVCFQCIGNRLSSKKVKDGDFCDEKYELLRNYFRNAGVLFGTEKRIYSDEE